MRMLLRDLAYERLRDDIVFGELPPDHDLREAELATALGCSKAPVREALARLTQDGLVVRKAQAHTRVAPLDTQQARDALVVVRLLHVEAAGNAQIDSEGVALMHAANDRFAHALSRRDIRAALAADDDLHAVIVTAYGNQPLMETIDRWTPLVRRMEVVRFSSAQSERSVALHRALIDACARDDQRLAAELTDVIFGSLTEDVAEALSPSARHTPKEQM
jgi:DNA-binding GntR family transcriptional regulator